MVVWSVQHRLSLPVYAALCSYRIVLSPGILPSNAHATSLPALAVLLHLPVTVACRFQCVLSSPCDLLCQPLESASCQSDGYAAEV